MQEPSNWWLTDSDLTAIVLWCLAAAFLTALGLAYLVAILS